MVKISQINPQPSKICAIDASTNSLAFSIFENKELSSIGKINFKGATTYDKVTDAAAKTEAFFREYGIPDAVIIEHTVFMNSPKTAADLALVQGGLLGAMGVAGVKNIKSINPIAWQTFIGNGRLTHAEKAVIRSSSPEKVSPGTRVRNESSAKKELLDLLIQYMIKKLVIMMLPMLLVSDIMLSTIGQS